MKWPLKGPVRVEVPFKQSAWASQSPTILLNLPGLVFAHEGFSLAQEATPSFLERCRNRPYHCSCSSIWYPRQLSQGRQRQEDVVFWMFWLFIGSFGCDPDMVWKRQSPIFLSNASPLFAMQYMECAQYCIIWRCYCWEYQVNYWELLTRMPHCAKFQGKCRCISRVTDSTHYKTWCIHVKQNILILNLRTGNTEMDQ